MCWSLIKLLILNDCYSGHIVVPATDLDELFVGLADDAALALVGAEDRVVVQRVVHHRETWN